MDPKRQSKVTEAWAIAYQKIGAQVDTFCERHGPPPSCLDRIREHAPTLAGRIDAAETAAEAASVEWANGGPGGVQAKIDAWVELWREGLELVSLAR